MKIKIVDGFVWAVLPAPADFQQGFENNEVFILHEDGSESLIQSFEEFEQSLHKGLTLGIEMGHKSELQADYDEACARNNEKRSFTVWLEDKAENLIY